MRIAICDDRTEDRDLLKKYCENLGYLDLSLFSSGKDLLESSLLSTIDLVFLDIEMQGYSGIEVKNILESNYPATLIVFCTTHSELMVDAFGKNVLSFLTKPYDEHMIQQSLGHASALAKDILSVSIAEGCKISSKDIVYFHSEQKYTIVYLTGNRTAPSRKSIKQWAAEIQNYGFCLISRSTIVNLRYVIRIQGFNIFLRGDISLTISRRYLQATKDALKKYMMQMIY